MAGSLLHGRSFEKVDYIGNDGRPHYEVAPVDGDVEIVSISSWVELLDYCERMGIERTVWPGYEHEFDVPLEEVRKKNDRIREPLLQLTPEEISELRWLERIVSYVRRGELFFFAE